MKEEIKKIIEMNRQGKISDEQLVELIENLKDEKGPEKTAEIQNSMEQIVEGVEGVIKGITSKMKGFYFASSQHGAKGMDEESCEEERNSFVMSKVDVIFSPRISGNSFNLSKVKDIRVDDSSLFAQNSINAAQVEGIYLKEKSQLLESSINAANVAGIELTETTITDLNINASNTKNIEAKKSSLKDIQINASNLNNCVFENCYWEGIHFNKVKWSGVRMKNVEIKDHEFSSWALDNVEIDSNDKFFELFNKK